MQESIDLFDGEKEQEYRDLINRTYDDERKYNSIIMDYILLKKDERLTSKEDKMKFDNATNEICESYSNLISLLDGIDGKQR